MAFRKRKRRAIDQVTLNLASMIDVTFLLLIYFMVSTVLAPDERSLDSAIERDLAVGANDERDYRPQRLRVVGGPTPSYRLGERVIADRSTLDAILPDLPVEAGIIIEVERGASVAFAVAAMQSAYDAGFEEVAYVPISR